MTTFNEIMSIVNITDITNIMQEYYNPVQTLQQYNKELVLKDIIDYNTINKKIKHQIDNDDDAWWVWLDAGVSWSWCDQIKRCISNLNNAKKNHFCHICNAYVIHRLAKDCLGHMDLTGYFYMFRPDWRPFIKTIKQKREVIKELNPPPHKILTLEEYALEMLNLFNQI